MANDRRRGFTLIEIMVSLAISMMLLSLAWSGFIRLRSAAQRNQASAMLALNAGTHYRRVEQDISATIPGVQMRLETTALGAEYGGAKAIRLIAMRELSSFDPGEQQDIVTAIDEHPMCAVWYCWEWRPPTLAESAAAVVLSRKATGSLWHGSSSSSVRAHSYQVHRRIADPAGLDPAGTLKPSAETTTFHQYVALRRSRRRIDLDDNDLRLVEGWPANAQNAVDVVDWQTRPVRVEGDRTDLMRQLNVVDRGVLSFALGWIDHQGYQTRATATGVEVLDPQGAVVTPPAGLAHWNADIRIVDGLWRDGRTASAADPTVASQTSPPDEGDIVLPGNTVQNCVQARPATVYVNFVLYDAQSGTEVPYTFSFQAGIAAPAWRNL